MGVTSLPGPSVPGPSDQDLRVRVRVRVAVQELTVQELSGSHQMVPLSMTLSDFSDLE